MEVKLVSAEMEPSPLHSSPFGVGRYTTGCQKRKPNTKPSTYNLFCLQYVLGQWEQREWLSSIQFNLRPMLQEGTYSMDGQELDTEQPRDLLGQNQTQWAKQQHKEWNDS